MTFGRKRPKTARERFGSAEPGKFPQTTFVYEPKRGCVYFIRCGEFVKIGFSQEPADRLSNMKTGNPFDMEILFVEKNVPFTKEKEYHVGFRDLHHRDEWFRFEGRLKIWLESKRK